jgi:ribosomal protein S6E (S10)
MTEVAAPPAAPTNAVEARTQLNARLADQEWGKRLTGGDVNATKEFRDLTAMSVAGGDDIVTFAMNGHPATMATTELAQMAHVTAMFRDLGIRDEATNQFLRGEKVSAQEYELVSNWKKEHMGDADWVKKYLSGDVKAGQQMMLANSILVNGAKENKAA